MKKEEKKQNAISTEKDYDETVIIAYQNINGNGWEKVEIPFKRKKR